MERIVIVLGFIQASIMEIIFEFYVVTSVRLGWGFVNLRMARRKKGKNKGNITLGLGILIPLSIPTLHIYMLAHQFSFLLHH